MQSNSDKLTRRNALKVSAILALMAGHRATNEAHAAGSERNSKALVAYLSRTGNTQLVARQIRRAIAADIFEIVSAEPYPEDYEMTVALAEKQKNSGFEPPLKSSVPNIETYDVIFLGFPIWGMTAPAPIRTFLKQHDMSGKTLVPFITHGGYGRGDSVSVLSKHAPRSRLVEPFVMKADQERQVLADVTKWLKGVPAKQKD